MAKTSKKAHGKRTFKASAFHASVFAKPTHKRCNHESKDGKLCSRFAGHHAAHFYVTPKEAKAKVAAWRERFL